MGILDAPAKVPIAQKILCLGTSITQGQGQGSTGGQNYVAQLPAKVTAEIPGTAVTVINGGVSGNTSTNMLARLQALLELHRPTHVHIETSVNDSRIDLSISSATSVANMRKMISLCRMYGATPIVSSSAPFDPVVFASASYDATSVTKSIVTNRLVRELCRSLGVTWVDLYALFAAPTQLADGLHPNNTGHGLWATYLARAIAGRNSPAFFDRPLLRAPNATAVGRSECGQDWTAIGGLAWGIDADGIFPGAGSGYNLLTFTADSADHAVVADVAAATGQTSYVASLVVRSDFNGANAYYADVSVPSGTIHIYKRVAGTFTSLATINPGATSGAKRIELRALGTDIVLTIDGIEAARVTDSAITTGTIAGLWASGPGNVRYSNVFMP